MEDKKDFSEIWDSLPKDIQKTLRKAVEESSAASEEQFIAEIMIGECPNCGSNQTKDCEKVEGIEDISVGLCMNCGYLWCSECGRSLVKNTKCNHWEICDTCDKADEIGFCGIDALDCEKLKDELA
ncbi:MAG: hypothetical protein ACW963_08685 [Candidatus Sifarchaeia archaeon]|jgi:hypothetical protein